MKIGILAVILVIFLVWVTFPTVSVGPTHSDKVVAKNDAVMLTQSAKYYFQEYNTNLIGQQSQVIKTLMQDNPLKIVFFEPDKKQKFKDGLILDPWGSPYSFNFSNTNFPWAYSFGKNRIDEGGKGDDVTSWQ